MPNRYANAAREAAELTNKQLGAELARLGPMNEDALRELLPTKSDKEEFAQLMALVEKETTTDKQLAYLSANLQSVGPMVFKVLKFFV